MDQPQGLSKGSEAVPNPPPLDFAGPVAGVFVADVHPPKSSSGATVGAFLEAVIGEPHPPAMSLGVILVGGLPISTMGAAGLGGGAGSGALHALSLLDDQGSNNDELLFDTIGGGLTAGADGLGADDGAERLKAE